MSTSNEVDLLHLDNQVCFPLYSASNAVVRAYRPLLKELDLTYLQYIVLMVLWKEKEINVKTLGEKLYLDSGTLTPLLKRLAAKGLVNRARSETDERVRIITLTAEGEAMENQARSVPETLIKNVNMSHDEMMQLKALCNKVLNQTLG